MKREVKGFGLQEYGIEWGYEYDEEDQKQLFPKGYFMIYVADNNDIVYVSSPEEAQALCKDVLDQWKD